jgi:hypothetical protein
MFYKVICNVTKMEESELWSTLLLHVCQRCCNFRRTCLSPNERRASAPNSPRPFLLYPIVKTFRRTADMNNNGRSNIDGHIHLGTKRVLEIVAANRRTPERREERHFGTLIAFSSSKFDQPKYETMRSWST